MATDVRHVGAPHPTVPSTHVRSSAMTRRSLLCRSVIGFVVVPSTIVPLPTLLVLFSAPTAFRRTSTDAIYVYVKVRYDYDLKK